MSEPFAICSGGKLLSCAAAVAHHNATAARPIALVSPFMRGTSLRHQRKGPHRAAGWHVLERLARLVCVHAAEARQNRDVLLTLVGVGDRLRVDAGAGLELPQRLAVLGVDGDELAGLLAGEQQA